MKKNVNILLIFILISLFIFSCSMDQVNTDSEKSISEEEQVDISNNTKALTVYEINKTTLLRIIHTYYQDYIEVSSLNKLQVITQHAVTQEAKITLNGKIADLYDLQKGDLLTIYYIADKKKTAKNNKCKKSNNKLIKLIIKVVMLYHILT